jgi:predicted metal-dependent hydrolase
MKIEIDNEEFNVIINHKAYKKNITISVKEDMNIYVSCNVITSNREVLKVLNNNIDSIKRMINKVRRKALKHQDEEENFYLLGKKYDIVYLNNKDLIIGEDKVFMNKNFDLDKWYLKKAKEVFQEELDKIYNKFIYEIPYPTLTIRKMKTRWGVCNRTDKVVTLNSELIKRTKEELDYVIIHELCHFYEGNHSNRFWAHVSRYCPNYKIIRKTMKEAI